MRIPGIDQPDGVAFAIPVEPGQDPRTRVNVLQPKEFVAPETATFRFIAEDKSSFERDAYTANFHGPETK
jgi:hypothetical protein